MDTCLKLWIYVDATGQNDLPFPDSQRQAEMHDFQYSATRMGSAPSLSGTLKYPRCLDSDWSDGHSFGDVYAMLNGERYFVKATPSSSKSNDSVMWSHEIQFESERACLDTVHMVDEFVDYNGVQNPRLLSNSTKFSFFGDLSEFAERLNQSMYLSGVGDSSVGTISDPSQRDVDHLDALAGDGYYAVVDHGVTAEACLVSVSNEVISAVIGKTWSLYKCGWYFDGRVIHIGDFKAASEDTVTYTDSGVIGARIEEGVLKPFMYGGTEAMLTVNRSNGSKGIYDYVTGTGSSDNIPFYYPNPTPSGFIRIKLTDSNGDPKSYSVDPVMSDPMLFSNLNGKLTYGQSSGGTAQVGCTMFLDGQQVRDGDVYGVNHVWDPDDDGGIGAYQDTPLSWVIRFSVYSYSGDISISLPMHSQTLERPKYYRPDGVSGYLEADSGESATQYVDYVIPAAALAGGDGSNVCGTYEIRFSTWDFADGHQYTEVAVQAATATTESQMVLGWYLDTNGIMYDIKRQFGIEIHDYGECVPGDCIEKEQYGPMYIAPQGSLMPSLYRNTDGSRRFYPARNYPYDAPQGYSADTALGEVDNSGTIDNPNYTDPSTSQYMEFQNEYDGRRRREHIEEFADIRPSIKGMTNSDGVRVDMVEDIAFDLGDDNSGEYDGGSNFEYSHPYFFVKLRKTDGAEGFNVFSHAIDDGDMKISFTIGDCASCEFTIGVDSNSKKNTVQVDSNGDLVRDSEGNVVTSGVPQDVQNDTQHNSVWVALKKEKQTFGDIMPYHDTDSGVWLKPSACSGASADDGDTFVILNIKMPEAYVLAAEEELTRAIVKWMSDNNGEMFTFSMKFSRCFLGENQGIIPLVTESSKVLSEYNGVQSQMYVSSYQYSMQSSSPIPEITIGLAATVEEMASQKSAGGISDRAVAKINDNFGTLMMGNGKPMRKVIVQAGYNTENAVRKGIENAVVSDTELPPSCVITGVGGNRVSAVLPGKEGQYLKMSGGQPVWAEGGGGEQNVQSDWSEDDPDDPSYILNKPDLSLKMDKVAAASSGSLAAFGIGGQVVESQYSESDITSIASSVSSLGDSKMDIVQNPHGDMIALVNSSGQVVEGTLMEEDVTRLQTGKMDIDADAVQGDVAVFDSAGSAVDSGTALSSLATSASVGGKMDKVAVGTNNDMKVAVFSGSTGQVKAGSYTQSQFLRTAGTQTISGVKTISSELCFRNSGSQVVNEIFNDDGTQELTFCFDGSEEMAVGDGFVKANAFVTDGGTSSQFVKGDGSLDSTQYLTQASVDGKMDRDVSASEGCVAAFGADGNAVGSEVALSDVAVDPSYVHTDNNLTDAMVTKIEGIEAGAQVNVQSDWDAVIGDAMILNKPSIPADSNLVHKTYTERIDGSKTFVQNVTFEGYATASWVYAGGMSAGCIVIGDGDRVIETDDSDKLYFHNDEDAPIVVGGIAAPVESTDAANKAYVDAHTIDESNIVHRTGDEVINGEKLFTFANLYAADIVSGYDTSENHVRIEDATTQGNVVMWVHDSDNDGDIRLTGLLNPSQSNDAANKSYVDSAVSSHDSNLVHKTGDETIRGCKTFVNSATFSDEIYLGDLWLYTYQDDDDVYKMYLCDTSGDPARLSVADPRTDEDAASKGYVDSAVSSVSQVQSDWDESDPTEMSYILNKPVIPDVSGKMDKVAAGTAGYTASVTASGQVERTNILATNIVTKSGQQDITGSKRFTASVTEAKKFKTTGGTSSQFVKGDGSLDSTAYAAQSSLAGKMDRDTSAYEGDIAVFDTSGNAVGSGISVSDSIADDSTLIPTCAAVYSVLGDIESLLEAI